MSSLASVVLSLLALVLAAVALVLATIANRRWATRRRGTGAGDRDASATAGEAPSAAPALLALQGQLAAVHPELTDLREGLDRQAGAVSRLEGEVQQLASALAALGSSMAATRAGVEALTSTPPRDPTALRHVALVRYDAFADLGGRLSYSVALLDDTASGLVLTTLAAKAEVRTYVRTVSGGSGDAVLTAEEQRAVEAAMAADGHGSDAEPEAGQGHPSGAELGRPVAPSSGSGSRS
ncbi:MAG TPA: DUF4446 family protein [Candidatus Nanopelagicales bacterium]